MRIPVTVAAEFRGLARKPGSFVNEKGEQIDYGESYKFEVADADGVLGELVVSQKACDNAAEFDVSKLDRGTVLTIAGVVGEDREGRMYFSAQRITKGLASVKAA